jgi:hypothetical protein
VTTQTTESQIAKLDTRVTAIESSLDKIGTAINGLSSKLDERSRTPWAVLISAGVLLVGILGVVGTAWKDPIERIIARQEADIRLMREDQVPRVEIDNLRSGTARERDDLKHRIERLEGWMLEEKGTR